jgi:SNF2 family DNA or RNA helicase
MSKLRAEMVTRQSLIVRFRFDPDLFEKLSKIAGGTWVPERDGGPGFKFILDMTSCKRLRQAFGNELTFSPEIIQWGVEQEAERKRLEELSNAETASDDDLSIVRERLPEMFGMLRDYQKAGIRFIANARNPLVADDPGLGKTWEVIAGTFQAGLADGPNLVVCPKISIESVWLMELSRFQENAVFVAPEGRKQRERLLEEVEFCLEMEEPFWLIINPAMLTYRRNKDGHGIYDAKTGHYFDTQFPFISTTAWNTIIMDEAHLSGIANASSQTARSVSGLTVKKRIATTGTPAGGKAHRLWGILHWLDPKEFSSRTRWSDQWLVKSEVMGADGEFHANYTGMQREHEAQFYRAHAHHILRRKKSEVYKEMPEKNYISRVVPMSEKQAAQYALMKNEADVKLSDAEDSGRFSAANVLTTYSWLKQFANAYCEIAERERVWDDDIDDWVIKYKAIPTPDSPKLEALLQILDELDVPTGDEQVVVFSQFKGMANMVAKYLNDHKIPTVLITGDVTSREQRAKIQADFQAGIGAKVIVMTTKAGGVSINLDRANTVVFLDETWDPDDQTQAEDRCHRASRVHQVTVYKIRTKGTIETQVVARLKEKTRINEVLLDLYRKKDSE